MSKDQNQPTQKQSTDSSKIDLKRKLAEKNKLEVMTKYNISCEMIPVYHYKTYKYSNLDDAVSQAKREENIIT
ncbi:MAG: hypothetical protein KDF58_05470 [Alphaproteobacteria bacterium]|nr:hypothetical protein [Alphaproteobacteria bacterium]HPF47282.1 hypothetical protein [Emcibacteraceae bacterium]HRW28907.1 hypothetical protein [Emcibacteraceae bacterium]